MFSVFSVFTALAAFSFLIISHELGHYFAARFFNIKVEEFGFGLGRRLFAWRRGETIYSLRLFPLGGFVSMQGENDVAGSVDGVSDGRSFSDKTPLQRMVVVGAGPLFNVVLTYAIFCGLVLAGRPAVLSKIESVEKAGPAYTAGMKKGDEVVSVNGHSTRFFEDLAKEVEHNPKRSIVAVVKRPEGLLSLKIVPDAKVRTDILGDKETVGSIGVVATGELAMRTYPIVTVPTEAASLTWDTVTLTARGLGKLLIGEVSLKEVGGPISVAKITATEAQHGIGSFFLIVAILSINVGLLNLLPVPVLDGGHMVFCFIEALCGRPVGLRVKLVAHKIGITLLLLLMLVAFYNDLSGIVSSFLNKDAKAAVQAR